MQDAIGRGYQCRASACGAMSAGKPWCSWSRPCLAITCAATGAGSWSNVGNGHCVHFLSFPCSFYLCGNLKWHYHDSWPSLYWKSHLEKCALMSSFNIRWLCTNTLVTVTFKYLFCVDVQLSEQNDSITSSFFRSQGESSSRLPFTCQTRMGVRWLLLPLDSLAHKNMASQNQNQMLKRYMRKPEVFQWSWIIWAYLGNGSINMY